jgi:hypothetical protein
MTKRVAAVIGAIAVIGTFAIGQAAFAATNRTSLETRLTGAKEVPGPGDPDGRGAAHVTLRRAAGKVCADLEWDNITTPAAGHIHVGPSDVAGPIVVDLLAGLTPDELEADNHIRNCVAADPALIEQIAARPHDYYVNLHNSRFPGGAIRGELRRS